VAPFQNAAVGELEALARQVLTDSWYHLLMDVFVDCVSLHRGAIEEEFQLSSALSLFHEELSERKKISEQSFSGMAGLFVNCHSLAQLQLFEIVRRRETALFAINLWHVLCQAQRATLWLGCNASGKAVEGFWQKLVSADLQSRCDYFMLAEAKARTAVEGVEETERFHDEFTQAKLLHKAMIRAHSLWADEKLDRFLLFKAMAPEAAARQTLLTAESQSHARIEATLRPIAWFSRTMTARTAQAPRPPGARRVRPAPLSSKVGEDSVLSLVAALGTFLSYDEAFSVLSEL
jgi:hypothetical protein